MLSDKSKIAISFIEKLFLAFLLALFGTISFMFANYQKLSSSELALVIGAIAAISFCLVGLLFAFVYFYTKE